VLQTFDRIKDTSKARLDKVGKHKLILGGYVKENERYVTTII